MESESEKNRFVPDAPPPYGHPGAQQQPMAPGFVVTVDTPNVGLNDSILAAQAVNTAINQNGRNPVTVVCPTCRNTTVTEIKETPNTTMAGQGRSKMFHIFFGGAAVAFIIFFIVATLLSGSWVPLGVGLPAFLILLLVGFTVMKRVTTYAAKMGVDIEHRCSSCHVLLGVNSGAQMMAQTRMQNRRYNR